MLAQLFHLQPKIVARALLKILISIGINENRGKDFNPSDAADDFENQAYQREAAWPVGGLSLSPVISEPARHSVSAPYTLGAQQRFVFYGHRSIDVVGHESLIATITTLADDRKSFTMITLLPISNQPRPSRLPVEPP